MATVIKDTKEAGRTRTPRNFYSQECNLWCAVHALEMEIGILQLLKHASAATSVAS